MTLSGELFQLLDKYRGGDSEAKSQPNAHQDFDQVAQAAPQSALTDGIAEAFRSKDTPPFSEMISHFIRTIEWRSESRNS